MAHKSREPERLVRGKLTRPHDRGDKHVGPQFMPGEEEDRTWPRGGPGGVITHAARRRRLARHGAAHELIKKLDLAILQTLSGPRVH
jgi:hypothetical protein